MITSIIDVKKTAAWRESGFPARFLGDGFTGHSGRVGLAQDLAATGVELPALMTAGRWKSSRMPARYTEQQAAGRGAVPRYYRERSGPNISNRISQSP